MPRLAHVNIRTARLEDSVAFYREVLGFAPGPAATRPGSADHMWMSDEEGNPCIHLQSADTGSADEAPRVGMHHLALACSDPAAWRETLRSTGTNFTETEFAAANILQFNLRDPDGVRIELLFSESA